MDKMWFYAPQGKEKQGPISESELRGLIAAGQLVPSDLAWSEGMAEWAPISTLPAFQPAAATTARVREAAPPAQLPPGLLGWMSFVGVVNIVIGALNCVSCFGIFVGVFMIMAGVALMGGKAALANITAIDPSLAPFFQKFKTFIMMTGIMYIVGVVAAIIGIAIYMAIFAAAFSSFSQ